MPTALSLIAQVHPMKALKRLIFLLLLTNVGYATTTVAAQHEHDHDHDHPVDSAQARDLVRQLSVASPYRISPRARGGEIDYRLTLAGGVTWQWPETGEQHAELHGTTTLLRVCDGCGQEAAPSTELLQQFRRANAWVQSDHPSISKFARRHGDSPNIDGQMQRLVKAVRARMTGPIDFRDYLSAVDAYKKRSGDCTEFAVLLAAAARASGIPTRLVYGIAYSSHFTGQSHVFSPHNWVQAWNGERWRSYDAGFGQFDSGHIALLIYDGSPQRAAEVNAAIRALRIIDAAAVVRSEGSQATPANE